MESLLIYWKLNPENVVVLRYIAKVYLLHFPGSLVDGLPQPGAGRPGSACLRGVNVIF